MELNWITIGSLIFAAWCVQSILTIIQMQNYRKHINALIHDDEGEYLGIGTSSGRIRAGAVVAILTDDAGGIIKAERMKGRTVFARFKPIPNIVGRNIEEITDDEGILVEFDQNTRKSLRMASDLVRNKMYSAQSSLSPNNHDERNSEKGLSMKREA